MHVVLATMCANDTTTMKRWAPIGLPDEFDAADATFVISSCFVGHLRGVGRESWGSFWNTTHCVGRCYLSKVVTSLMIMVGCPLIL